MCHAVYIVVPATIISLFECRGSPVNVKKATTTSMKKNSNFVYFGALIGSTIFFFMQIKYLRGDRNGVLPKIATDKNKS
jgi:hypothetical protein